MEHLAGEPDMNCPVCQQREPDRPLVCDADRGRLGRLLREIPDLYAELGQQDDMPDQRAPDIVILSTADRDGRRHPLPLYDPVRAALPSTARAASNGGRVSGTPEASAPVNLDLVDLTAHPRGQNGQDSRVPLVVTRPVTVTVRRVEVVTVVHEERDAAGEMVQWRERVPVEVEEEQTWTERVPVHGGYGQPVLVPAGDQIGYLPAASLLDAWVTDWRLMRGKGEGLPRPVVDEMCAWLLDRLDEACDQHPAVGEFAADLGDLHSTLRAVLGLTGPWPELLRGVPCRRCDVASLARLPVAHYGAQQYIECGSCGDLMTPEEYERWTQLLAAGVRGRKTA